MKIIGISCYYHDSAAAIIIDNEIIASCQEERFTRNKHTSEFPANALKFCLEEAGITLSEVDAVVFYDKPVIKFERLLSTFYSVAPLGLIPFLKSMPIWIKQKIFLKKLIKDNLIEIGLEKKSKLKILFTEHHISHAASAFYPSNLKESAILTIDGVGEWCTASICMGKNNKIEIIKELYFPNSVGLLYSAFTYFLGFKVNSGEYKLMGLAPYGAEHSSEVEKFINIIKNKIVKINDDGSIKMNKDFFTYTYSMRMINDNKFYNLFKIKRRNESDEITQTHCNIALAIQKVLEEIVIKMAKEAKRVTHSKNLCLSGGVALNCVANGKLQELNIFENIYIQPASGDAGGSLGCALAINHMYYDKPRVYSKSYDLMQGSYLGPYYSSKEIINTLKLHKAKYTEYESFEDLSLKVAKLLSEGNVIGWFQGRSEFGPRALGNRSILADPRNYEMQKKLNLKIKYREGFRPFAPSVLEEDSNLFFEGKTKSPYMLEVRKIKNEIREKLPYNYNKLNYWDKLYTNRSKLQAVTHVDFSARVQTVSKASNPKYWNLINNFKRLTNIGVLVNTSFNVRGEPIVNSPEDAFKCFMNTEMDYLVLENFFLKKEGQTSVVKKQFYEKD